MEHALEVVSFNFVQGDPEILRYIQDCILRVKHSYHKNRIKTKAKLGVQWKESNHANLRSRLPICLGVHNIQTYIWSNANCHRYFFVLLSHARFYIYYLVVIKSSEVVEVINSFYRCENRFSETSFNLPIAAHLVTLTSDRTRIQRLLWPCCKQPHTVGQPGQGSALVLYTVIRNQWARTIYISIWTDFTNTEQK